MPSQSDLPQVMSPRILRLTAVSSVVLLSQLTGGTASAGAAESADVLISRGLELRREGKPTDALRVFEQAHAIAPSPRTFGNLGLTEASLRRWVEASEHLEAAIAAPEDLWTQKNQSGLQQALELARQHVGEIAISGPVGAEVSVGGRRVGILPLAHPIRVATGTMTVKAVAPDYQPYEANLTVGGGDHVSLNLALTRSATPFPAPPPPDHGEPVPLIGKPPAPAGNHRTWRTGAGVGLFAAAAGILTWGVVWIAIDGNSTSCGTMLPGAVCPVYDTGTKGWVIAGIGAATGVSGGVLLYLDRRSPRNVILSMNSTGAIVLGTF